MKLIYQKFNSAIAGPVSLLQALPITGFISRFASPKAQVLLISTRAGGKLKFMVN